MASVILRAFDMHDLLDMPDPRNSLEAMAIMRSEEFLEAFEPRSCVAFSGYVGRDLIGCSGIYDNPQDQKEVWLVGTPLLDRYPLAFHRAVKRWYPKVCKNLGIDRTVAHVRPDMAKETRWIKSLGFVAQEIVDLHLWGNSAPVTYIRFGWEA